jgi:hypothetical protein
MEKMQMLFLGLYPFSGVVVTAGRHCAVKYFRLDSGANLRYT